MQQKKSGAVARSVASSLTISCCIRTRDRPYGRQILSWRFGHENISTAILPLQKRTFGS